MAIEIDTTWEIRPADKYAQIIFWRDTVASTTYTLANGDVSMSAVTDAIEADFEGARTAWAVLSKWSSLARTELKLSSGDSSIWKKEIEKGNGFIEVKFLLGSSDLELIHARWAASTGLIYYWPREAATICWADFCLFIDFYRDVYSLIRGGS